MVETLEYPNTPSRSALFLNIVRVNYRLDQEVFYNFEAKAERGSDTGRYRTNTNNRIRRAIFLLSKKTNKIYIWLAVDRVRAKVVDFEVTTSRDFAAYLPLALRLDKNYKIELSCSDHYDVYGGYKIAREHYFTKKETALVESFNSLLRHYLARFNRKTKRYSKAIDMIYNSILILFNKSLDTVS